MNLAQEELLITEKQYLDDLAALVQLSRAIPAYGAADTHASKAMFVNVAEILECNQSFAAACMEDNCSVEQLAKAFINSSQEMIRVYRPYVARHLDALQELERHMKDKRFKDVVQTFLHDLQRQSLSNLIIKPMQRICKYGLFFQQVIQYNDKPNATELLKKALDEAMHICNEIEEPVTASPRVDPLVRKIFKEQKASLSRSAGSIIKKHTVDIHSPPSSGSASPLTPPISGTSLSTTPPKGLASSLEQRRPRKLSITESHSPPFALPKSKTSPNLRSAAISISAGNTPSGSPLSGSINTTSNKRERRRHLVRELVKLNTDMTRVCHELHELG